MLPATAGRPLRVALRPGDVAWSDFLARVPPPVRLRAHVADAYEVTNILFSSGTTGGLVGAGVAESVGAARHAGCSHRNEALPPNCCEVWWRDEVQEWQSLFSLQASPRPFHGRT